jgi:hypothetical protein
MSRKSLYVRNLQIRIYIFWWCLKIVKFSFKAFSVFFTFMGPCIINIFKHNRQDATLHNCIYYYKCCTCFRRFFCPSSGAQNCRHSIGYLSSFFCFLPLSWVGTGLHVLLEVYTSNSTRKPVYHIGASGPEELEPKYYSFIHVYENSKSPKICYRYKTVPYHCLNSFPLHMKIMQSKDWTRRADKDFKFNIVYLTRTGTFLPFIYLLLYLFT